MRKRNPLKVLMVVLAAVAAVMVTAVVAMLWYANLLPL
jgi:uncharacterized protein involved in exopolysaccharide biosynthesis